MLIDENLHEGAVAWLIRETSLTFDQIAAFYCLDLEHVAKIADGTVDPRHVNDPTLFELTEDELRRGEADPNYRLRVMEIAGRGEREEYTLKSPHLLNGKRHWISLEIANSERSEEGIQHIVRQFGVPCLMMTSFYAHRDLLRLALRKLQSGGWAAVKEAYPKVLKYCGSNREPKNLLEWVYRELEDPELHGVRSCKLDTCGRLYVPHKQGQHQSKFCPPDENRNCQQDWNRLKKREPLLREAIDLVLAGNVDEGRSILYKYVHKHAVVLPEKLRRSFDPTANAEARALLEVAHHLHMRGLGRL